MCWLFGINVWIRLAGEKVMAGETRMATRDAEEGDAVRLAELAGQLGYPSTAGEIGRRLSRYAGLENERVIVAVDGGRVVGWTSVAIIDHFYLAPYVEISGLVVDSGSRGRGLGSLLIAEVERWAAEKRIGTVRLRANVVRAEAHRFYEKRGFVNRKTQYSFEKTLAS